MEQTLLSAETSTREAAHTRADQTRVIPQLGGAKNSGESKEQNQEPETAKKGAK